MGKKYDKSKTWTPRVGKTNHRRDSRFADLIRTGKTPGGSYRPGKSGGKKK